MDRLPFTGTRWFSLSGRELLSLAAGVGLVVAGIALARGVEWAWGRGEITVTEAPDVLPTPARLNLNTAAAHELELLPGIGPSTARAIMWHRAHYGPFADWDDVLKVPGIGPRTVEEIRPHAMCAPVPQDGD